MLWELKRTVSMSALIYVKSNFNYTKKIIVKTMIVEHKYKVIECQSVYFVIENMFLRVKFICFQYVSEYTEELNTVFGDLKCSFV